MKSEPTNQGRGAGRRSRPRPGDEPRPTAEQRAHVAAWFAGRLPGDWFTDAPRVTVDGDEILVVGELPPVTLAAGATPEEAATAESARIAGHREDTRDQRMRIADEAQRTFGRIVSWGAACGTTTAHFTTASVPVMTRLRLADRQVLDTLIDAGVARSRSEALAWCVRLVGHNEQAWIGDLRVAFAHVEAVRAKGPSSAAGATGADDPGESGDPGSAAAGQG